MHLIHFIRLWCLIDSFSFNLHWYKDIFASSFIQTFLRPNFSWQVSLIEIVNLSSWFFDRPTVVTMVIRVVEFSNGGHKIGNIFAKESTYPKEIIEFWELVASCQKLGIISAIKWFKNWCYHKMSITENVLLNWYSSMEKKLKRFRWFLT